jgi:hypothetical protein
MRHLVFGLLVTNVERGQALPHPCLDRGLLVLSPGQQPAGDLSARPTETLPSVEPVERHADRGRFDRWLRHAERRAELVEHLPLLLHGEHRGKEARPPPPAGWVIGGVQRRPERGRRARRIVRPVRPREEPFDKGTLFRPRQPARLSKGARGAARIVGLEQPGSKTSSARARLRSPACS